MKKPNRIYRLMLAGLLGLGTAACSQSGGETTDQTEKTLDARNNMEDPVSGTEEEDPDYPLDWDDYGGVNVDEDAEEDLDLQAIVDSTDFSSVDFTVSFGDSAAMQTLQDAMTAGEADGMVVHISGTYYIFPGRDPSIMEYDDAQDLSIGLSFVIPGYEEEDYGAHDDDRVDLTGVMVRTGEAWGIPAYIIAVPETEYQVTPVE